MEYMRTQASIEKFVIITMRDGRKKYVAGGTVSRWAADTQ